jgi:hypothetical protein
MSFICYLDLVVGFEIMAINCLYIVFWLLFVLKLIK